MATKVETVALKLVNLYKEQESASIDGDEYVICDYSVIESHDRQSDILTRCRHNKDKSRSKKYKVTNIKTLPNIDNGVNIYWDSADTYRNVILRSGKNYRNFNLEAFSVKAGTYKIELLNSDPIYVHRYLSTFSSKASIIQLAVCTQKDFKRFLHLMYKENRKLNRVKNGAYLYGGSVYVDYSFNELEVIHPAFDDLKLDINYFFDNLDMFGRYNTPVCRKVLLVGPPGTGKTSMCESILREYSKSYNVTSMSDLEALYKHTLNVKRSKRKSIAILEDGDTTLSGEVSSEVLNFLSGTLMPNIKTGLYIIITTNRPNDIHARVLRPGRIDKRIEVNKLVNDFAVGCAKIYLPEEHNLTDGDIREIFSGLYGSQIKKLVEDTIIYSATKNKKLTKDTFKYMHDIVKDELEQIVTVDDSSKFSMGKPMRGIGFNNGGNPNPFN